MTVGSFKSDRTGRCECGNTWEPGDLIFFKPGERGYWCWECEQERMGVSGEGPRWQGRPPGSKQSSHSPVESDAQKGHRENMESARLTRDVIIALTVAVSSVQKELSVLVTLWRDVQKKGG